MPYTYDDLLAIQANDPDGGDRKPTENDYARHKAWAISQYGPDAWDRYAAGDWGREPGYHAEGFDYDDEGW
jgi:hypothetical protein